jgi:hypothetical protein
MTFSGSSLDIAEFVKDLLFNSRVSWQSITITPRVKYEGYYVTIATDGSWDVIVRGRARFYSLKDTNT